MTYELNAAFDRAAHDDSIKVIIVGAEGPHFSAGHDLSGDQGKTWRDFPIVGTWADFDAGMLFPPTFAYRGSGNWQPTYR